ncbi:MAG: DEAD/DEAH box helicase [Candidatus Omnitrophica bacterium]|nr:DEAD/DEAH box helicase [Candidatus Omnitrophota bacterium]
MTLDEWQIALRREYGREQDFQVKNIGNEPIFSEFLVSNPKTERTYRVAIRGKAPGDNYCSCPDFAVNALGTCKHIEFMLTKLERKRGAKKAFREGFQPPYSEVYLRYGAKREVRFQAGSECPAALKTYASKFFKNDGTLRLAGCARFETFLKNAPHNGHELRCYEDAIQYIAQWRDDEARKKKIDRLFPQGADSRKFRDLLKVELYPYQKEGALFAARSGRCLIGDDMGLGKTVQAIAAAEILARTAGVERVLIVAPTSLKHQWKQEIQRFSDRSANVVEGPIHKREEAFETDAFYKIIHYDVIHRDKDIINEWKPDLIILDEAQRIKNWKTRRAQSVKRLESEFAFVLTGTPLENRLEELHSIVEFVDNSHLGALFRFLDAHQHVDEAGKVIGYKNLSAISQTLKPILIRRTKNEVLKELPKRIDKHFFVSMTEKQMEYHEENRKIVAQIVAKWRRFRFLSEQDQRRLMIALQNMRMACDSTFLLDSESDHGVKADEAVQLLEEVLEDPQAKVVLFSQWIGMHQLIIERLEAMKRRYAFFHGSLSSQERGRIIQSFQEDPDNRIFLSTDSGGVGLNLQNSSVIVNMDQPWNPAVLEQRIGRVHRMGQKRLVQVYHFVAQGTIEHSMLDVLAFKKSVFAGVLDGGEDEVFLGGSKLKKFMETVDKVTTAASGPMTAAETPPPAPSEEDGGLDLDQAAAREEREAPEAWMDLASTGMEFLGKLGRALQSPKEEAKPGGFVQRDEKTGEAYLKLPVPDEETLKKVAQAAKPILEMLQGFLRAS